MAYTKFYDFRKGITNLTLTELNEKLIILELEWDKWFCLPFAEDQEAKVLKQIGYVKERIDKLTTK